MTVRYFDNVRHAITTTGTGAITLGSVPSGWQSFDDAGAVDGDNPPYELRDGNAWETGYLTLDDGVTTATRLVTASSDGGDPLDLSGSAVLTCTVIADVLGRVGSWEQIGSDIVGSAVSIAEVTGFDPDRYRDYHLSIRRIKPVSGNGILALRTSQNGGSSYDNGASDYVSVSPYSDGGYMFGGTNIASYGYVTNISLTTTTNYPAHGDLFIKSPQTAQRSVITSAINHEFSAGTIWLAGVGTIWRATAAAFDAFALFLNSGNTFDIEASFYGRRI